MTILLCWAMFLVSLVMIATAITRLALCCCCPVIAVAGAAGMAGMAAERPQSMMTLCCEALCIAWLVNWCMGR